MLSPTRVWGARETTEMWTGQCQQVLSANAICCFETKEVSRTEGLESPSTIIQGTVRALPGRGNWWIRARIGFYSTLAITRGNSAWPYILSRLSINFSPILITIFGLSPADNTIEGRTRCPFEITDTEPAINISSTSLQPLVWSWFFKGDPQHCHCTSKT